MSFIVKSSSSLSESSHLLLFRSLVMGVVNARDDGREEETLDETIEAWEEERLEGLEDFVFLVSPPPVSYVCFEDASW